MAGMGCRYYRTERRDLIRHEGSGDGDDLVRRELPGKIGTYIRRVSSRRASTAKAQATRKSFFQRLKS